MEKFSELIRIRRSMRKFTEEELIVACGVDIPFFQGSASLGVRGRGQ